MGQRGRKSAAALSVASPLTATGVERLAPASHLTDAEKALWVQVVNDNPADAFSEMHSAQLELYCKHILRARILGGEIDSFDPTWLKTEEGLRRYDQLLKMAERESRAASSLATRLRITRQAVHQLVAARANKKGKAAPWEG